MIPTARTVNILRVRSHCLSRVGRQSRTGRVRADLPESLARYMDSIAVHPSAAPWSVSVYRGAPVMDPVTSYEGEDTVTTATTS